MQKLAYGLSYEDCRSAAMAITRGESSIVVLGDLMVDMYVNGKCLYGSKESAGIATLFQSSIDGCKFVMGGAGQVSRQIMSLGSDSVLCAPLEAYGFVAKQADLLIGGCCSRFAGRISCGWVTQLKVRVRHSVEGGPPTTVSKIDFGDTETLARNGFANQKTSQECIDDAVNEVAIGNAGCLVISDYRKGLLALAGVSKVQFLIAESLACGCPVVFDMHRSTSYEFAAGSTLVKINVHDLGAMLGMEPLDIAEHDQMLLQFAVKLRCTYLVVTLDASGMVVVDRTDCENPKFIRKPSWAPGLQVPTAGAGDSCIAAAAMVLGSGGRDGSEIACAMSAVAGVRLGDELSLSTGFTDTPRLPDVLRAIIDSIVSAHATVAMSDVELDKWIEIAKRCGKRIGFTNGIFDLLHAGHIETIRRAAKECDLLVVAVNSDDSARRLKGKDRPVMSCENRIAAISAIGCAFAVVKMDHDTPHEMLRRIGPHVLVKGGTTGEVVGAELVGEVVVLDRVGNLSTTSTIERVLQLQAG